MTTVVVDETGELVVGEESMPKIASGSYWPGTGITKGIFGVYPAGNGMSKGSTTPGSISIGLASVPPCPQHVPVSIRKKSQTSWQTAGRPAGSLLDEAIDPLVGKLRIPSVQAADRVKVADGARDVHGNGLMPTVPGVALSPLPYELVAQAPWGQYPWLQVNSQSGP